ncbi:MAG: hypothetical protein ACRCV9_16010, partial [Burkholderiaceae bacterium]
EVLARADLFIKYQYLLVLSSVELSEFEEVAAEQLAQVKNPEQWRPRLAEIMAAARESGFSEDGAILLTVAKHGA